MAEGITRYAGEAAEQVFEYCQIDDEQGVGDLDELRGAIMCAIDAAQLEGIRRLHRLKLAFEARGGNYEAALSEALRQLGKTEKDLEAP